MRGRVKQHNFIAGLDPDCLEALLGFTAREEHLSIHPFSSDVVAAVADDLAGFSLSKGTIRFTPETPLPQPVLERMVRLRLAEITGS